MDPKALFLIIDDDPDLLAGMARILRRDGHKVITASTGTEGIRLAHEKRPDIAVIDMMLPDMTGINVCQKIQASSKSGIIDIILISSTHISSEDQVAGFNAGVCEYLTRPLPNKEFLARVNIRFKDKHIKESLRLARNKAQDISVQETTNRIDLQEELKTIFLHAPVALFLTDGNAKILKANPALSRIFDGNVQSAVNEPSGVVFDCLNNADHAAGCGFGPRCSTCDVRSTIDKTFSTGMPYTNVESYLNCRQKDKIVERIVRFSTSLVMLSGEKQVFVCMEDITDSKQNELKIIQNEKLFRRTFDQSPIGAAMVGLDHRFLKVNQELCRITGYQAVELEQLSFPDITFQDDLLLNLKQAGKLTQGQLDHYEMDKRYIRKDGTLTWVKLSVRLIRDSQGTPLYTLPMMVEINARKRLEEEKDIQLELLRLISEDSDLNTMISNLLSLLTKWFRADAIGIRIRQGEDFPYYKTIGFPEAFVHKEKQCKNPITKSREPGAETISTVANCICNCVINRLYNSSSPFFTRGGSFFTNSARHFLSQNGNCQQFHDSGQTHCHISGYESVLLVPLRVGTNTLGLIQLNHKEKNHFTEELVLLLERLADNISVAVTQRLADERLKVKQAELEEMNITLKILIKNREEELQEHDREILANVRQLILPCVEQLKLGATDIKQKSQLNILESNLQTITSPFAKKLSSTDIALTPVLIQIADMIKKGLTSKEIARLQGVSVKTVDTYRKRIRARLKLQNSKTNLRAYLLNME